MHAVCMRGIHKLTHAIWAITLAFADPGFADPLDELLRPEAPASALRDGRAAEAWRGVVDAFRKNDMARAVERGKAFLAGDFSPSPYQLLGVKVMIGLAGGAPGDQLYDDPVLVEEKQRLEEERKALRQRYQDAVESYNAADARVNEITMNRKRPVQQGSANYYECMNLARQMDAATAILNDLKGPIEANKKRTAELAAQSAGGLKAATLKLLDLLLEAGEIEAAFAVGNTYLQKIGNDLEIAKKQQDIIRLEKVAEKAAKVVALLEQDLRPLVEQKFFWAAKDQREAFLKRVSTQSADADLTRLVRARLAWDGLGIDKAIQAAASSMAAIERQAQTDYRRALVMFDTFKTAYPDCPEIQALTVTLAERRNEQMGKKLAELVAEMEVLAESNPEQALLILPVLEKEGFDPVERLRLEVRIKNLYTRVVASSIAAVATDLETVKTRFDPPTLQALTQSPLSTSSVQTGLLPEDIRLIKARLRALQVRIDGTEKLPLSDEQRTKLSALKSEVSSLHNNL